MENQSNFVRSKFELKFNCNVRIFALKEYWPVAIVAQDGVWAPRYGDIAQLGERGVRIAEVGGSSPPISTNRIFLPIRPVATNFLGRLSHNNPT